MKHIGDISVINGFELEPVDVVTGGSPCQDLSVAGKRLGIKQFCNQCDMYFNAINTLNICPNCNVKITKTRSGLFIEQIRIIKEMRKADEARGRTVNAIRPRYMVWENVPGAFSSNRGEDFRIVLEETIKIIEPDAPDIQVPNKGRWPKCGCFQGVDGRWSIAWRVFDAQFWGVPQRRRRIALVADFGGSTAPEILFIRKGLSGDYPESGAQGQGTARTSFKGLNTTKHNTLNKANSMVMCLQGSMIGRKDKNGPQGDGINDGVSFTLNTIDHHAVFDARGNEGGTISSTLIGDHQNRITDYTTIVLSKEAYNVGLNSKRNMSIDAETDTAFTVFGKLPDAICLLNDQGGSVISAEERASISPTLRAEMHGNIPSIMYKNDAETEAQIIRRLTPLECERLQGYEDGWTNIPTIDNPTIEEITFWKEVFKRYDEIFRLPKQKQINERSDAAIKRWLKTPASDTAKYKVLGNSIALPPWKWVLKRISAFYERDATLGSLFDGIGGFPLLWEQLNGCGTARWASEIDPFCIAITRHRFNNTNLFKQIGGKENE